MITGRPSRLAVAAAWACAAAWGACCALTLLTLNDTIQRGSWGAPLGACGIAVAVWCQRRVSRHLERYG
jgi:hypothetical protein